MIPFLSITLFAVFAFLSGMHFYWVAGGRRALDGAMLPEMWEQVMRPERQWSFRLMTLVVAIGLGLMAYLMLSYWKGDIPALLLPYRPWITLGVAAIFTIRAVGDFKKVGLFQRGQTGIFAERDKAIYSPLCVVLAVGSFLLWWLG
ncbi:DUF3995 domain-containing protein [Neolewinella agarilytica]|uniref:DUF3995 domain-containing protein n=1 Tax=Neolewinella agarilytica TaxID=478744 RepID=A0A1H9LSS5_9BACT|nr:DUF3995 domain-containing protein [Neolewinella agarilytica]SER13903.1 Protein of unknown function [Neolewinella agarilytica]